jgi:hypothetical protein
MEALSSTIMAPNKCADGTKMRWQRWMGRPPLFSSPSGRSDLAVITDDSCCLKTVASLLVGFTRGLVAAAMLRVERNENSGNCPSTGLPTVHTFQLKRGPVVQHGKQPLFCPIDLAASEVNIPF